jgi:hypothetical protein
MNFPKKIILLTFWLLSPVYLPAQTLLFEAPPVLFEPSLSPRIANYSIDVRLDTETNFLHGKELLIWKNSTSNLVTELQFHLYLNAFRNNQSTFMIEAGRRYRGLPDDQKGMGYIEINHISRLKKENFKDTVTFFRSLVSRSFENIPGMDLTATTEYIHPDTKEHIHDKTVLRLPLPEPLAAGDSVLLFIDFSAKLPEPPYARTGVLKEYYMVGQWFPKAGVYTDKGWNCHQFHTNSEFFADFGVYNVWITVPEENILGATGVQVGQPVNNGDGSATHFYHAEDVHDFAWTTSPEFVEFKGISQDVDIRVLMQPDHIAQGPRHVEAAKVAVEYFQNWFGDYPYPNVTMVDPRRRAKETGGMEYPTLFTGGTFYGIPEGIRLPETVIIHEFGHNYWPNEFEETWLDEGITSYSELQILNDYYGPSGDLIEFMDIKLNDLQFKRFTYLMGPDLDATIRNAWEYYSNLSYAVNSYDKPAVMLTTLQNLLGRETMNRIMRTYFERWKFKHPSSEDFIAVVNDVSGRNFDVFFDQALYTNAVLDYSVDRVFTRPYISPKGYDFEFFPGAEDSTAESAKIDSLAELTELFSAGDTGSMDSTGEAEPELYYSGVNIRRLGEFKFPVEVEVFFEDGEVIRETWNGQEIWEKFRYLKPVPLVSAVVDPENKLVMDINFTNNSKAIEKRSLGTNRLSIRWMFWMQFLLDQPEFLNLLTTPLGFN